MASARKKKPRGHTNLTAERVRDEALRLIEAEGLAEFSTRKLGRALGVEAMAIYWYYPSKDALLDAVVEHLIGKLGGILPTRPGKPVDFVDALRKLAHAYRALAHSFPEAFPLLATRRFATEPTYRFLDDLFAIAEQHGLDAPTTARFYRLISSYCNGIALDELAGVRQRESRKNQQARSAMPRLASVWGWLSPEHDDESFSFGLELLLAALRNEASSRKPTRTSKARGTRRSAQSRANRHARSWRTPS